jgi:tetratricopeptide (TPR) repeat protein
MRGILSFLLVALLVAACGSPMDAGPPAPESAEEYKGHGESLAEEGEYPEAIDHFSAALEMEPEDAEIHFLRGRAHYDYAIQLSRDLTGQPPEGVPFLPDEVTEQLELAVVDYTSTIELDPQYAKAYNNRGNAHALLGALEEALGDYDQALELDETLELTYFNRGLIHYRLRNYEASIADLEMYLELVPDAEERARLLGIIDEMKEADAP